MTTELQLSKLMALMAITWPHYKLEEAAVKVYYDLLKDIDYEYLELAAKHLMTTNTFFPALAEWRKAAVELKIGKLNFDTAEEAWEKAWKEDRRVTCYGTPKFENPLIMRTINCFGGWWNFCQMEDVNEFTRSQFFKFYNAFLSRIEENARLLPEILSMNERLPGKAGDAIKILAEKMTK